MKCISRFGNRDKNNRNKIIDEYVQLNARYTFIFNVSSPFCFIIIRFMWMYSFVLFWIPVLFCFKHTKKVNKKATNIKREEKKNDCKKRQIFLMIARDNAYLVVKHCPFVCLWCWFVTRFALLHTEFHTRILFSALYFL